MRMRLANLSQRKKHIWREAFIPAQPPAELMLNRISKNRQQRASPAGWDQRKQHPRVIDAVQHANVDEGFGTGFLPCEQAQDDAGHRTVCGGRCRTVVGGHGKPMPLEHSVHLIARRAHRSWDWSGPREMLLRATFRSSRRMVGVAAGSRIGPEPSAVTVLGRSQKQEHQSGSHRLWITRRLIHDLCTGSRPVDNLPRYTRSE
jgi:hypothetical protein